LLHASVGNLFTSSATTSAPVISSRCDADLLRGTQHAVLGSMLRHGERVSCHSRARHNDESSHSYLWRERSRIRLSRNGTARQDARSCPSALARRVRRQEPQERHADRELRNGDAVADQQSPLGLLRLNHNALVAAMIFEPGRSTVDAGEQTFVSVL
jgi:hypothetical protein